MCVCVHLARPLTEQEARGRVCASPLWRVVSRHHQTGGGASLGGFASRGSVSCGTSRVRPWPHCLTCCRELRGPPVDTHRHRRRRRSTSPTQRLATRLYLGSPISSEAVRPSRQWCWPLGTSSHGMALPSSVQRLQNARSRSADYCRMPSKALET